MSGVNVSEDEKFRSALGDGLAVVGMGCLFPRAGGIDAFWSNIRYRVDGIGEVPPTHWQLSQYFDSDPKKPDMTYGRRGGFLSTLDFDPLEFGISPNTLEATDTSQLLSLVVARQALLDAGCDPDKEFDRKGTSVILGITGALELVVPLGARLGHPIWRKALKDAGVESGTSEDVIKRISDGYVSWQENSFPGLLGNVVAGRVANRFDLGGTNCVVDAACASSLSATHLAALELATGRTKMVLTGGVDTFNDIFMFMCFSKTPALSPSGDSRPFDRDGDGTILGEGIGMVVLKRLADAQAEGNRIYCLLKGIGTSSDGRGKSIYAPSASGQKKCLEDAYKQACIEPSTVELVEAHGTGTKVGDAIEATALSEVYHANRAPGVKGPWCAMGSVKSQIGHTKAAAGAAGFIKAALALYHKVQPPTMKVNAPLPVLTGPDCPVYLNTDQRPWISNPLHPRRAAVSAFGFGGSNFHAVLEEYRPEKPETAWDGRVQVIALSANTIGELSPQLTPFVEAKKWDDVRMRAQDARNAFDVSKAWRLGFVLEEGVDVAETVKALQTRVAAGLPFMTPEGAWCASGAPGKLGLLFPGQGAQYVGMGRDLACTFPSVHSAMEKASRDAIGDTRVSDRIFPIPVWEKEEKLEQELLLRDTRVAQPAIGAVSAGMLQLLREMGIAYDAVAGHSYGELVALYAAGRISEDELISLSRERGERMAEGNGDRGAMLAVAAPVGQVEGLVTSEKLDLTLANKNAPDQTVLSGPTQEIERAAALFTQRGMRAVRLPVAAAFHSSLVADAARPFRAALEPVNLPSGRVPVYANSTASPYPDDATAARDLLGNQLAQPVEFVSMIEAMYADGVRTFVEVGPGARLTGLVGAILKSKPYAAVSVDGSAGRRAGVLDLARVIAQLVSLGHAVDLSFWQGGEAGVASLRARKASRMSVPLNGANYRAPRKEIPPVSPKGGGQPGVVTSTGGAGVNAGLSPAPAESPRGAGLSAGQANAAAPRLPPAPVAPALPVAKAAPAPASSARPVSPVPPARSSGPVSTPPKGPVPAPAQPAGQSARDSRMSSDPTRPNSHVAPAAPRRANGAPDLVSEALRASEQSMVALQQHQEQLAALHRQFLEGQQQVQRTFHTLVEHQQSLFQQAIHGGASQTWQDPAAAYVAPEEQWATSAPQAAAPAYTPAAPAPAAPAFAPQAPAFTAPAAPAYAAPRAAQPAPASNMPGHTVSYSQVPPVVAPAARPAPVAAAAAPASSAVTDKLMEVVSEKTGYPPEMLKLDMDMESDLGIDSIKRVEIFSAVQEALPDAPVVKPENMGTLRTLGQVVSFLAAASGGAPARAAAPAHAAPAPAAPAAPAVVSRAAPAPVVSAAGGGIDAGRVHQALLAVVADKTGYPPEMLKLDMDMESDLGIDSIKRVEILSAVQEQLPEAPVVKPEHMGTLRTLGQVAAFLTGPGGGAPAVSHAAPAPAARAAAPAPAPSAPSAMTAGGGVDVARVHQALLAVVADKTGYPPEMLKMDMDMESDLGIDSIKRVEILSAVQEQLPEAPVVKPEHMGTLRTLGQVAAFLTGPGGGGSPVSASPAAAPASTSAAGHASHVAHPAPAAPAGAPVVSQSSGSLDGDRVQHALLSVVADKTGYPPDMLKLEMDMESDLGIDSIKRVEILSAVQELLPEAPVVKPEHMGTLRTLAQVVEFLSAAGRAPASAPAQVLPQAPAAAPAPVAAGPAGAVQAGREAPKSAVRLKRELVAAVALPSQGEPSPALVAGSRVWIVGVGSPLEAALAARLKAAGLDARAMLHAEALQAEVEGLGGLVLVHTAARAEGPIWHEGEERALKEAFRVARRAGPALRLQGRERGAFLITVSRLDGAFGVGGLSPDQSAMGGGLAGLSKTAGHEWADVRCRAFDVVAGWDDGEAADAVAAELAFAGPVEVGLAPNQRTGLTLVEEPAMDGEAPAWQPGDVVVVTGGARGVTAEVCVALGERFQPTFVLLGRTPLSSEPAWLAGIEGDAAIKRALLAHADGTLSPRALEGEYQAVVTAREVRRNLERVRATGAGVAYEAVDVRDPQALSAVLDRVRAAHGPVRGIVHGAGVLADKLILEKTAEQFDAVFDTKVGGLRALLTATAHDDLTGLILFTSVTGRFGRAGQVDYAMANEVLDKVAQREARRRSGCRVRAVAWGPWEGGMVTPALRKVFEKEGVGLIPLASGAQLLADELTLPPGRPAEILVMAEPMTAERPAAPLGGGGLQPAFERRVALDTCPVLRSHVINGKPVLPMALIAEWLAHAALHGNPGLHFHGLDDLRVTKGVVLAEGPVTVRGLAGRPARDGQISRVAVELRGTDAKETLHARATVLLAAKVPHPNGAGAGLAPLPKVPFASDVATAYADMLFHGPELHAIRAVESCGPAGIAFVSQPAPAPAAWLTEPLRDMWLADPMVLDAAFQGAILWTIDQHGAPCLPSTVAKYRQYRTAFPREGVHVALHVHRVAGKQLHADVLFTDSQGVVIAVMNGFEATMDPALAAAFRRRTVSSGSGLNAQTSEVGRP